MTTLYLFWIIVGLQFADLALTIDVLIDGGREVGPVKWLFGLMGRDEALFAVKGLALTAFLWAYGNEQIPLVAYWIILAIYVAVVGNNLLVRRRQRKMKG